MHTFESLKTRHRETRERFPPNLNLRIHRALSWLQRAEQCEDIDGEFIFLWIAFNAAYATELRYDVFPSEQAAFRHFLEKLCEFDTDGALHGILWQEYSGSIRILLNNPYVFRSFWQFQNGQIDEATWEKRFERGKARAKRAIATGNSAQLLFVIFDRMYVLRNQLIHGGATWNSDVNRRQLRDCAYLLNRFVPTMVDRMLRHPEQPWGNPSFPVISDA